MLLLTPHITRAPAPRSKDEAGTADTPLFADTPADPFVTMSTAGSAAPPAAATGRGDGSSGWQLVVLGVAQDGGMPHIGCESGPCGAARAGSRPAARVACLGLRHGDAAYLFDATPDLPAQLHALRGRGGGAAAAPDGIFLTHAHVGHYLGLAYLGREGLGASGVPVYASARMRAFLTADAPWRLLVSEGRIELRDNGAPVDLGAGMRVSAFATSKYPTPSDTCWRALDAARSSSPTRTRGPRGAATSVASSSPSTSRF